MSKADICEMYSNFFLSIYLSLSLFLSRYLAELCIDEFLTRITRVSFAHKYIFFFFHELKLNVQNWARGFSMRDLTWTNFKFRERDSANK